MEVSNGSRYLQIPFNVHPSNCTEFISLGKWKLPKSQTIPLTDLRELLDPFPEEQLLSF
jgi:hypothetical protein